jgi:hypothetical protein
MNLSCGEVAERKLRVALVALVLGAGVHAQAALAFDADSTATFSSMAQQRPAFALDDTEKGLEQARQDVGPRSSGHTDDYTVENASSRLADDDSLTAAAALPRLDTSSTHYNLGEGWRELHGGGWLSEREFCGDCRTSPSAIPEMSTKALTAIGLLAVVWFVRRSRPRAPITA